MHVVEILMALVAWVIVLGGLYLIVGIAFALLMSTIQSYQESKAGWSRNQNLWAEIGHWLRDLFRWTLMWPGCIWAMFKR